MAIVNPPPQRVPAEYKKNPNIRDYEERQKEYIRLLHESVFGDSSSGAPSASEFSQRYTLLLC